jgi:hypothetical protein
MGKLKLEHLIASDENLAMQIKLKNKPNKTDRKFGSDG